MSTNRLFKHFKVVHRRLYDALKEIGDDHGSQQCIIIEGVAGQLKIEARNKRPLRGLTPDEMKDVIARLCASLTLLGASSTTKLSRSYGDMRRR